MRRINICLTLFCLLSLTVACLPNGQTGKTTADILVEMGAYPCPDSDFTCVKIKVPLDHNNPENGQTTDVVFGVLPATGESRGLFVTVTGGPGSSGLSAADSYTSAFDPGMTENFDIVFFDQRGMGASGGLQCAEAAATYYQANFDVSTPEGEAAAIADVHAFAESCAAEMGNPAILPYLGTSQAIEDLELFRQAMGNVKIWLYGESYGTQFAQAYAAAHPEALVGLILDGTVDLTLSGTDFLAGQAAAFDNTLTMTLEACNADSACAADMGKDAVTAYNELAAGLKITPRPFDFPLPGGNTVTRNFSLGDLEFAASSYMYSESGRMIFLRALATAVRYGDMAPMARILYDAMSVDPETLAGIPDPTFSDAIYYGVECQDYSYFSGTPAERAEAWMRAGDAVDASMQRFSSIFYGDLPCVFWPSGATDQPRPEYITMENVPTLVLGSTADPATPLSNGRSVFEHLANGYLVIEAGGPHVIYGWGNECVDSLVADYLVNDQMPALSTTVCDGVVTRDFVPLAPRNAADFMNILRAVDSVYYELYYLPEYYYWDIETPITTGCPFGGTFAYAPSDIGEDYTITDCAFSDGFIMNGTGGFNYDDYSFTMNITVTGLADGTLTYVRQDDGSLHLTGTYDGQTYDLTEAGQ